MDVVKTHKYCSSNKIILEKNINCLCFYCFSKFKYNDIKVFIDNNNMTALCPKCGIDSVLPDKIDNFNLNLEFLDQMKKYWFS